MFVVIAAALVVAASSFGTGRSGLLTVTVMGNGSVDVDARQIVASCGHPPCRGNFRAKGKTVTVTAVPNADWRFLRWTGACTTLQPTCTLSVVSHVSLGAIFMTGSVVYVDAEAGRYTATSTLVPAGEVTFDVVNDDPSGSHDLEICTDPVRSQVTRCAYLFAKTPRLKPGQEFAFTVALNTPGLYEYFSTVPGEAARGMTGLISVTG
jgi:uncharacterized cupredoxin-like copper-binding protein